MFGKMKDRAAGAAAAGMAAASNAATKAAKTAKYGVAVAKDALGTSAPSRPRPPPPGVAAPPNGYGYAQHADYDDDEEMELQRALAASMKTAAAEERSRGPEGPEVREVPPRVAPAPPGLDMLTEMGFDENLARIALQASDGDVEAALAQLCADRDDLDGAASDESMTTPTHRGAVNQRQNALEAAEKRLAEARSRNAGTMDDWRRYKQQQEQRRKASRTADSAATTAPAVREAPVVRQPPAPGASCAEETEEWMLQQALAASMKGMSEEVAQQAAEDPELFELRLQQAMAEEELELQQALSASLGASPEVDPSCAGAAVGEEAEQEEERARLSAAAQHHLSSEERQEKEMQLREEQQALEQRVEELKRAVQMKEKESEGPAPPSIAGSAEGSDKVQKEETPEAPSIGMTEIAPEKVGESVVSAAKVD